MATSPLFGWEEPDDTDLVKDGAAAIRTLGNAIDTSMGDLLGGTSGQVLSKNSNTNMDFTWVTPDDANAIQNAIVDAKGDLITATAADTPARLAVGTNGQTLVADSSTATGLKWATASSGGMTLIESKSITTSTTYNFTSIPSGYINLVIILDDGNENGGGYTMVQFNGDTGNNYNWVRNITTGTANYNNNSVNYLYLQTTGSTHLGSYGTVFNYLSAGYKPYSAIMQAGTNGTSAVDGGWVSTSAITSMLITFYGAPTAQGTLKLYGVK